jgi:disulfide bond formation protein DsbB
MSRLSWACGQFLFLVLMMVASYFFEYVVKLTPCALCVVQRVLICGLLVNALWTIWRVRRGMTVVGTQVMAIILTLLGLLVAWRHIWLQQHADIMADAACLPDIRFMLKMMPLPEVIMRLFSHGGAECSKIKWQFLGLTMPGWVAISYVLYIAQVINLWFIDTQSKVDSLA